VNFSPSREKRLEAHAGEIAHYPVVIEDAQLVVRKRDREEPLVAGVASAVRMGRAPRRGHPRGGRRSVMPVGDVERRNVVEERRHARDAGCVANRPDRVADAVLQARVRVRCAARGVGQERVDLGRTWVRHEHRPCLGVEGLHVANAVVLLVGPRVLVLADAVRFIGTDRRCGNHAGLHVVAGAAR
jgi:hypothetical protein